MLNASIDYTGSFDDDKVDPDVNHGAEDSFKSGYNRYAATLSFSLKTKRELWMKSLDLTASSSYEYDVMKRTRFVQLQRMTVAPLSMEEGENDAFILPYTYTGHHETSLSVCMPR